MIDNKPYNLDLLWEACNFGLDYFHEVYPESVGKENRKKHFKTHDEKSASTTLSNASSDGFYKTFNHSSKESLNAIDHVIKEKKFTFLEACDFLFAKYNLKKSEFVSNLPTTVWNNDTDKKEGYYKIDKSKKTQNFEFFAPFLSSEICKEYDFISVDSYEKIMLVGTEKNKITSLKVSATENYPIFAYSELKEFSKIYEPKSQKNEKGFSTKHHFLGKKPEKYIYGWNRLFKKLDLQQIENLFEQLKNNKGKTEENAIENWSIIDETIPLNKETFDRIKELQIDYVFIATGGSDALNIASLGYDVIWFNSEAEIISSKDYYQLCKIAKNVIYVPDNDKTGIKQAVSMGMRHLKIKMMWLPEIVNLNNSQTKIKDLADWVRCHKNLSVELVKSKFKQELSLALPFQFWEFNPKRATYGLNNDNMINFLKYSGFGLYKVNTTTADSTNVIEETRFVQIVKNIVKIVSAREVKVYVLDWIKKNYLDQKIYNMVMKSVYFSDNALLMLPEITLDTKTGTKNSQLYFFSNKVVKISDTGIEANNYDFVENLVWESNVIKHNIDIQKPYFDIKKDESGNFTIEILNKNSNYLKVLINTSRMFWKKDANENDFDLEPFEISSKNLTIEEQKIQQLHLINKIYTVGYLLHKHKQKSKPYFVLGIDNKIGKNTKDSNGGSGKSFLIECCEHFLKNIKFKDGKEMPKEDPKFTFDGVTKETDLVFMDDMVQGQDYKIIFSKTSGTLVANHKGGKIHTISFYDSSKFAGTTNFVPNDLDAALQRRLLPYACSDFYHEKTNDDYFESRKISHSFGNKDLYDDDYSTTDWNNDYNFRLQCLQFFLSQDDKISAPEENLIIRNLKQKIGDVQLKITDEFFEQKDENGIFTKRNVWFLRQEIQEDYNSLAGKYSKTPVAHKDALEWYCKMNGWELQSKKIAMVNPVTGKRNAIEHYFVNTTNEIVPILESEKEVIKPIVIQSDIHF
jgi:hypothetical protein